MSPSFTGSFRFCDWLTKSLRQVSIRILLVYKSILENYVNVAEATKRLLLCSEKMDDRRIILDNIQNKLICSELNWTIAITSDFGQIFVCLCKEYILSTENGLLRLQQNYYHHLMHKAIELTKHSSSDGGEEKTTRLSEKTDEACCTCQNNSRPQKRFTVSIPCKESKPAHFDSEFRMVGEETCMTHTRYTNSVYDCCNPKQVNY